VQITTFTLTCYFLHAKRHFYYRSSLRIESTDRLNELHKEVSSTNLFS
jgi:hypothetical protein